MIEREHGAVAAIMHCAWHECSRAEANDATACRHSLLFAATAIAVDQQTGCPRRSSRIL